MTIDEIWEKYGERWKGKETSEEEYVMSCTDPDEVRALWISHAPLDDGYWQHCYGGWCAARLEQLQKAK